MKTAYKFLRTGLKSNYDNSKWVVGKWRVESKPIRECEGLNASKNITDALSYVRGEILAKVEYGGIVIDSKDKITCEKMRVVKIWKWDKIMSVRVAVYAAKLVLSETIEALDDRPRRAIEAAEAWLKNPVKKTADAADAAAYAAACASYAAADAEIKVKVQRYILSLLKENE